VPAAICAIRAAYGAMLLAMPGPLLGELARAAADRRALQHVASTAK
jgi:hypothetical protein